MAKANWESPILEVIDLNETLAGPTTPTDGVDAGHS